MPSENQQVLRLRLVNTNKNMNSWDNYYKEFESKLSDSSFCISLKETDENINTLETLGYSYAEDADTIDEVGIGEFSLHTYEEFDDNDEVIICEDSVEIYHKQIEDASAIDGCLIPEKKFVEKWFGIKEELILGITGGF